MIPIYKHYLIMDAPLRDSKTNKYWLKESLGPDFKGNMEHASFKWPSTVQYSKPFKVK